MSGIMSVKINWPGSKVNLSSFTSSNPVVHVTLPQSFEIKLVSEAWNIKHFNVNLTKVV